MNQEKGIRCFFHRLSYVLFVAALSQLSAFDVRTAVPYALKVMSGNRAGLGSSSPKVGATNDVSCIVEAEKWNMRE